MKDRELEQGSEENEAEVFDIKSKAWIEASEFYKGKCLEALRQSGITLDYDTKACKEGAEAVEAVREAEAIEECLALYGSWKDFYEYGIDEFIAHHKSIKQTQS